MKKLMLFCAAFAIAMLAMATTGKAEKDNGKKGKHVEISFDYLKQKGPGSNQFAVWMKTKKARW